ncbi:hypothetical protein GPX89_34280 [Nocardia sp. ET3-3]|uniref:Uncharacterized protein n=1 Tax=Nocardia terrae TaxID=2675851 RepID=A0A7K1V732_9NOCA|nr:hypothetical protein [Nocardia terrae]MVU82291.1 hypothetical protein [Nocardia terrae]
MNAEQYRRSREQAVGAVADVLAVLEGEPRRRDVLFWQNRFAEMARYLANTEVDDEQALRETSEFVSELYARGRNITDFYLVRTDFDEQRAVNIEFENKLAVLERIVGRGKGL